MKNVNVFFHFPVLISRDPFITKKMYIVPTRMAGAILDRETRNETIWFMSLYVRRVSLFLYTGMKTFIQPFFSYTIKQTPSSYNSISVQTCTEPNIYRSLHVFRRPSCWCHFLIYIVYILDILSPSRMCVNGTFWFWNFSNIFVICSKKKQFFDDWDMIN